MTTTWIYAIASVSTVSIISLMGVFAFAVKPGTLSSITRVLVSLATGAMLGNAVVHLIPESFENVAAGRISAFAVSLLILGGFLTCFALQKVLNFHCHHSGGFHHAPDDCASGDCHDEKDTHRHIHPTGHMSLLAHGLDNLTDGILIGVTYLVSIPSGLATSIAIVSHEIPMEFGGFGVLVSAGFSKRAAVLVNFLSGIVALAGTVAVLAFGTMIKSLPVYLTPVGAGIVLYITAAGLIPQLQQEQDRKRSALQVLIMLGGVAAMVGAKMFEMWLGV